MMKELKGRGQINLLQDVAHIDSVLKRLSWYSSNVLLYARINCTQTLRRSLAHKG